MPSPRPFLIIYGVICAAALVGVLLWLSLRGPPETSMGKYQHWATTQPRPTQQIIDRIEGVLSREPCIGSLARWSRKYSYDYDSKAQALYPDIIRFELDEAGKFGVQPGRRAAEPSVLVGIDDRPIKMASGDYDLKDGRLHIFYCGNNFGAPGPGGIDNLHSYIPDRDRRRSAHRVVHDPSPIL